MPTVKARRTKHKALTPKHKQTKKYLQVYWPYIPLMVISILIISILQPWNSVFKRGVLPYATNVSVTGLLNATNQQRSNNGEGELNLNTSLTQAAQAKSYDMASHDYWAHTSPDGKAPWVFVTNAGYQYTKAGENLAYGFLTSDNVISGWMNSPEHKANILDTAYQDVGFGFADSPDFDNNGPATIVVAMYGEPIGATADKQDVPNALTSFNTLGNYTGRPEPKTISKIQAFTKGIAPWVQYAVGAVIGAVLMYLVIKHGIYLRRHVGRTGNGR